MTLYSIVAFTGCINYIQLFENVSSVRRGALKSATFIVLPALFSRVISKSFVILKSNHRSGNLQRQYLFILFW